MSDLVTALLWWPVITYIVGVVVILISMSYAKRQDDSIEMKSMVRFALMWPWDIRLLFR